MNSCSKWEFDFEYWVGFWTTYVYSCRKAVNWKKFCCFGRVDLLIDVCVDRWVMVMLFVWLIRLDLALVDSLSSFGWYYIGCLLFLAVFVILIGGRLSYYGFLWLFYREILLPVWCWWWFNNWLFGDEGC